VFIASVMVTILMILILISIVLLKRVNWIRKKLFPHERVNDWDLGSIDGENRGTIENNAKEDDNVYTRL